MSDSDLPTNTASRLLDLKVVAGVIVRNGLIFAAKRREGGAAGLKWEFPGGKIEQSETSETALKRELKEELEIDVKVGHQIGTFSTPVGKYLIQLECYWCTSEETVRHLNSHVASGWFAPAELSTLDWATPDVPAVEIVVKSLPQK